MPALTSPFSSAYLGAASTKRPDRSKDAVTASTPEVPEFGATCHSSTDVSRQMSSAATYSVRLAYVAELSPALASAYTENEKVAVGAAPELNWILEGDSTNPYSAARGSTVTSTESVSDNAAPSSEVMHPDGNESSRKSVLKLSGWLSRTIVCRELETQKLSDGGAGAFACWASTWRSAMPNTFTGGVVRSEHEASIIRRAAVAAIPRLCDIGRK